MINPTALKERFNYASADCAAVVLRANREARGLTSILNNKKDQYMLNECAVEDKFVVVELCDDILVDTIVLGNYEFFSSTFKDVMVYVSDRYPPKNNQWTFVGHFQGFNSRDAQVFPVADPRTWARYVKFEFLSHYGQEFYCPLTVLKVYGATQMEQYRLEEEEDEDEELLDSGGLVIDTPLLGYHGFGLPYGPKRQHAKHQQPLQIDGSVSPASSYLKDLQGFASECQMCEAGEPQSTSRVMPKVPNLPWDQEVTCEATDQEYDEDNDDDDDVYDNDDNDDDEAEVAPKRAESREGREGAQDPLGRAGGTATATAPQRKQESIFKTIMRRLARVERNVTLAYHYLEEQHLVFNLVLQQVELNNLETMQLAIDRLNRTTSSQIKSLSMLSEEVWRAILYDLEEYHQHTQTDMADMGSRLEFLASEVLFEKRMNVAQLVLLLTIVVMIALSKAATKLALIPESKKEK
ncbi:hypothetical protein GGF46_004721 [Coemansia sp. RSA 552]|nr:hypothetical protein GGF46_004721 [Coemansia sp. RSA 552]